MVLKSLLEEMMGYTSPVRESLPYCLKAKRGGKWIELVRFATRHEGRLFIEREKDWLKSEGLQDPYIGL